MTGEATNGLSTPSNQRRAPPTSPLPSPRWVATVAPVREHGGRHSHRSRGDQETRQQQQQQPTLPTSARFPPKLGEGTIVATPSPPLPPEGTRPRGAGTVQVGPSRLPSPPHPSPPQNGALPRDSREGRGREGEREAFSGFRPHRGTHSGTGDVRRGTRPWEAGLPRSPVIGGQTDQ